MKKAHLLRCNRPISLESEFVVRAHVRPEFTITFHGHDHENARLSSATFLIGLKRQLAVAA